MAQFTINDLYALDKAVKKNIEIFKFHTPKLDNLKALKKVEENLISKGVLIIDCSY